MKSAGKGDGPPSARAARISEGEASPARATNRERPPKSILAVDVGGRGVKILATGQSEPRRRKSGPGMTPQEMVAMVREMAADWTYEAVSVGYPGQVGDHGPRSEPGNLGPGWVGFNFPAAFE